MTPAINAAKKAKITYVVHEYEHDPAAPSYGLEAADKLGIDPERVFKTLVAGSGRDMVVAIVPVAGKLDLKLLAKAVGQKKIAVADAKDVERVTGYVLGGVSPLGQKKLMKTVIDSSARNFDTMHVSAGRRGLEIELAADDLASLTRASFASIAK